MVSLPDRGSLTYLQWSDFTCNACGGQLSSTCLVTKQVPPQRSCPGDYATFEIWYIVSIQAELSFCHQILFCHMRDLGISRMLDLRKTKA